MRTSTSRERTRSHGDRRIRIRRPGRRGAITARRTLEAALITTMDDLRDGVTASCPVCAERALTAAGCSSCGSRLS